MLKAKDIFALGVLAVASFPIVLLGVLLWTGNVRMVFGPESQDPNARSKLLERPEDIPGATKPAEAHEQAGNVSAGMSMGSEELDRREAELLREESRISAMREDAAQIRDTIRMERRRLEAILGKGDSLQGQRTAVLAATFSSMKPDAAAKILVALDDLLVTAILRKVSDDKPRAKLLAAVGKLDTQRAGRISRLLSTAAKSGPTGPANAPVKPTEDAKPKDTAGAKAETAAPPESTAAKEKSP